MTIEEFYNRAKYIDDDIIAIVMYKAQYEKEFTLSREIFLFDYDYDYNHCWVNEWYEFQDDIIILRWIRKGDIVFP